jgi:hypothetical protein
LVAKSIARVEKEPQVSHKDIDPTPDEGTGDTRAGSRADLLGDLDASAAAAAEAEELEPKSCRAARRCLS